MSENKKPLFIVIAGLSGSGKGTQAELLKEKYGFEYLTMGGLLREEISKGTELGKEIDEIIHGKGNLVPDSIAYKILRNKLEKIPKKKGIVIDGYPRSLGQMDGFEKILAYLGDVNYIFFNIKISDKVAIERLSKRRICPKCKENYIFDGNDSQKCRKCNVKLVVRDDDQLEQIKKRLSWGHDDVDPVLEKYRNKGVVVDINGEQGIEGVHKEILKNLEKYL